VKAVQHLGRAISQNKQNRNRLRTLGEEVICVKCRRADGQTLHHDRQPMYICNSFSFFTLASKPTFFTTDFPTTDFWNLTPGLPSRTLTSGGSRPGPGGGSDPSLFVQAPSFSTDYLLLRRTTQCLRHCVVSLYIFAGVYSC